MEIVITLEDDAKRQALFGSNDKHLRLIRQEMRIQITARDGLVRLLGHPEGVEKAAAALELMQDRLRGRGLLTGEDVAEIVAGQARGAASQIGMVPGTAVSDGGPREDPRPPSDPPLAWPAGGPHTGSGTSGGAERRAPAAANPGSAASTTGLGGPSSEAIAVYTHSTLVRPKTDGQRRYVEAMRHNDLVFCLGPAGTGKTYLATAMAVSALKAGRIKRIALVRPAVEAGEKLGYLPGDLQAKVNPYLRPLLDALHDMMGFDQVRRFMGNDIIEIAPLAFMRGRTLNDAVIILDEAQNTTISQMLMFLTRLGQNSKMIITGDESQVDLPDPADSGLCDAVGKLEGLAGIAVVRLDQVDIVRHRLVQSIVAAYGQATETRLSAQLNSVSAARGGRSGAGAGRSWSGRSYVADPEGGELDRTAAVTGANLAAYPEAATPSASEPTRLASPLAGSVVNAGAVRAPPRLTETFASGLDDEPHP